MFYYFIIEEVTIITQTRVECVEIRAWSMLYVLEIIKDINRNYERVLWRLNFNIHRDWRFAYKDRFFIGLRGNKTISELIANPIEAPFI